MEAERLTNARPRKVLSWCLALMLCAQMLGPSAMQAFANEASNAVTAARDNLGKNLVYDDVYGVKRDGFALMAQRGSASSGQGDAKQDITRIDTVDSTGKVLASFGIDDVPSSYGDQKERIFREVRRSMQVLMQKEFSFYCVPKNVNDKVKYGFTSNDGSEIAACRYDDITEKHKGEPLVAALDLDNSVVDVYRADGVKTATIPLPAGWAEKSTDCDIWFAPDDGMLEFRMIPDRGPYDYYVWDVASNSFLPKDRSVNQDKRVWLLPDGGEVTVSKIDDKGEFACTTPQGSFNVHVNDASSNLYKFDVAVDAGLIQYTSWSDSSRRVITQIWDFSGNEVTKFQGDFIEAYMGDGLYLCVSGGPYAVGGPWSIRSSDGEILKSLPQSKNGYEFTSPFIWVENENGACIMFDSQGNEVKKIMPPSPGRGFRFYESAVDDILVLTYDVIERTGDNTREVSKTLALTAYDRVSGKWLSSEDATKAARAEPTTLLDGTETYRIPAYDPDDGDVSPQHLFDVRHVPPAYYYYYVNRDLNALPSPDGHGMQTAYAGHWDEWQQPQRKLADGTIMTYATDESGKCGAIDSEGAVLIPFEYDAYYDCGDDDSLILLKQNGAWEFFDTGTINTNKEPVPAVSVAISDVPERLAVGATAQLAAAVEPKGSTDKVTWTSSNKSVLEVTETGVVRAVANGRTTITATAGEKSASVEIAVVTPAASVAISGVPDKPLNVGETAQLTAAIEPKDATDTVTWSSSDKGVLAVDADGLVTALANGEATITATAGEKSASALITAVTPATDVKLDTETLALYLGDKPSELKATVLPTTASNKGIEWKSSDEHVATVDGDGLVAAVGAGTCTVTATTLDGGYAATCAVSVGEYVSGVALDKTEAFIVGAGTTQLTATVFPANALEKSVVWSTDNEAVATVTEDGLVTSVGKGKAVITATALEDEQQSASCTVSVSNPLTGLAPSAASVALEKGSSQVVSLAAQGALPGAVDDYDITMSVEGAGSFADGIWSDASGKAVFSVAVGENGEYAIDALGTGKGSLVFEAHQESSVVKGVVAVSVTNPAKAITLDRASNEVTVGDEPFTLKATIDPADADEAGAIVWSASNADVATVENGKVTFNKAGSATIWATAGKVSAACELTVLPKKIAATKNDSAFQASIEADNSSVAAQLDNIVRENGPLTLAVQSAENLTEKARQAISSLQAGQTKVAEVLDLTLRNAEGGVVSVLLDDGKMTVRIRMTDSMRALDPATLAVANVADDGAIKKKLTWIDGDDLCFATEHFSTYVVTGNEPKVPGGNPVDPEPAKHGGDGLAALGDDAEPLLAPTGDTAALPFALVGCAIAAALVCIARVRGGRRVK